MMERFCSNVCQFEQATTYILDYEVFKNSSIFYLCGVYTCLQFCFENNRQTLYAVFSAEGERGMEGDQREGLV